MKSTQSSKGLVSSRRRNYESTRTTDIAESEALSVLPSDVLAVDEEEQERLVEEERLAEKEQERLAEEERRERALVVPPLLMHAYHLPGNNWLQDLWQYLTNNHPILGICFHHKYHPLKAGVRVATLIGSVLFGLVITNIIYLAFVFSQSNYDRKYMELSTNATRTGLYETLDDNISVLSVTNGNIALWTVGAFLHGLYDNTIWALAACSCCIHQEGKAHKEEKLRRYRSTGTFLVMLSVIVVTAIATFAAALRAALTTDDGVKTLTSASNLEDTSTLAYHQAQEQLLKVQVDGAHDYEFIVAYLVELALTYVVYYPVIGTVLFSGILTCGRYPVLGGRPYEIQEALIAEEQESDDENDLEEGVEVEFQKDKDQDDKSSSSKTISERNSISQEEGSSSE